jgi:hypothetical protein
MLETHIRAAGNQSRQIAGIMRRARAAPEQYDRIVEYAAIAILIAIQLLEECAIC